MKKFFCFLMFFPIMAFAQAGKYDFSESAGEYISNSDNIFYIIGGILIISMFGGWTVFKTVFTFFACAFALIGVSAGYMFVLFKIGTSLQVMFLGDTPKNNSIGFLSLLVFFVGWFTPMWIYFKKTDSRNQKNES